METYDRLTIYASYISFFFFSFLFLLWGLSAKPIKAAMSERKRSALICISVRSTLSSWAEAEAIT